jgi:hypothetical protein
MLMMMMRKQQTNPTTLPIEPVVYGGAVGAEAVQPRHRSVRR